jgi:Domain of unknown function (DUF4062)
VKKKLQVFVSSTFTDMLAERQAAVDAILRAGHIPAGMELFAAGDESQLETIRRWIDDSDVFMLILGGRYGSIDPKSKKSYIEVEYDYVTKSKKPLFAAVISDASIDAKVKNDGRSAVETTNGTLLQAFRERVTQKTCRFFSDVSELKLIVFESLHNFERNEGLAGWVRGSDVLDPKATLDEMARLQNENVLLRKQLTGIEAFLHASEAAAENPTAALSNEAKKILVEAKNADGYILYIEDSIGSHLQVGNNNLINPSLNNREVARWKAAVDELVDRRLIDAIGYQGETFRLTKLGYEIADKIDPTSGESKE